MAFHQLPENVTRFRDVAYAGQVVGGVEHERGDAINVSPASAQVDSVTIATATGGESHEISILGVGTFVRSNAGWTTPTLAATGLAAAWNNDPVFGRERYATSSGAVLTLRSFRTGLGSAQTVSVGTTATISTAAPADAASVAFGLVVLRAALGSLGTPAGVAYSQRRGNLDAYCRLPAASDALAASRTVTLGGVYVASEPLRISATIGGRLIEVVGAGANEDAAGAALAAALLADPDVLTATYTNATNVLAVTFVPGKALSTFLATPIDPASTATLTVAGADNGVNFDPNSILGVAKYGHDVDTDVLGTHATAYKPQEGLVYVSKGHVYVASSESGHAASDDVYLGSTGAEAGRLYRTAGASRIRLPRSLARWVATAQGGTAALALRSAV
jgi:hypothetical protein